MDLINIDIKTFNTYFIVIGLFKGTKMLNSLLSGSKVIII